MKLIPGFAAALLAGASCVICAEELVLDEASSAQSPSNEQSADAEVQPSLGPDSSATLPEQASSDGIAESAQDERSATEALVAEAPYEVIPLQRPEPDDVATEPEVPSRGVEEIVVTAQRREQSLQDVPISVSAFSEGMIAERQINSVADVALSTPGFVASQSFGQIAPTIRGIGADRFSMSSEPGVALYVDDIYLGRPYLPQATLSQIERIEILKGPQGTLYGRNTSGGAIKIVTRRPSDSFELDGSFQAGSFDYAAGRASISGPLTDWMLARLSLSKEERDGYTYNATRDERVDAHEAESARLSLDLVPNDWLTWSINADVNRQFDTGPTAFAATPTTFGVLSDGRITPALSPLDTILNPVFVGLSPLDPLRIAVTDALTSNIGGRTSTEPRTVHQDFLSFTKIRSETVSSTLAATIGDVDVKLIGGYADSNRDFPNDADLTDLRGITLVQGTTPAKQYSAELQATSTFEMPFSGELKWLAGGFRYGEKASEIYDFEVLSISEALGIDDPVSQAALAALQLPSSLPSNLLVNGAVGQIFFNARQRTTSNALFADLQWDPLHWLIVHLGARYTSDEKKLLQRTVRNPDPRVECENEKDRKKFSATTVRAGLDFLLADDVMTYVSYSQGFKSGGFNGLSCGDPAYDPEHVDAWEVGLKSQWLDGVLQLNGALFSYDYSDIQVEKVVGFSTQVQNAAKAKVHGGEISIQYVPLEFLALDANAGYLDAKYGEFFDSDPYAVGAAAGVAPEEDLSGNRLNKAPEWSGSVGAKLSYVQDSGSELSLRGEWSYTGSMFYDQFNHDFAKADSYEVWNAFLTFDLPQFGMTLRGFGKNLTDELYVGGQFTASALVGSPYVYYGAPRMFGAEIQYRFGG